MADNVMQAFNAGTGVGDTGAAQVAVSDSGVLALVRGSILPDGRFSLGVVGMDGTLRKLSPAPEPHPYLAPRFSPDGRRIAAWNISRIHPCLWVFDLARGTLSRPVEGLEAKWPQWSPDGKWLVFAGAEKLRWNLFRVPADGSLPPEQLTRADFDQFPAGWGAGGRELVFLEWHPDSKNDVMALPLDTRKARPLVRPPSTQRFPAVSPDGRWLAYESNKSGRDEVSVQPYAGGEAEAARRAELHLDRLEPGRPRVVLLTFRVRHLDIVEGGGYRDGHLGRQPAACRLRDARRAIKDRGRI